MTPLRCAPLLCASLLLAAAACDREWETVDEVRGAVLRAGVIGQAPDAVERRLAALRFGEGRRLAVDAIDARRSLIQAQLRDAGGRPRRDYNVNVTVYFRSGGRADSVEVFTSAVSPL